MALVGYGTMVQTCMAAAEQLAKSGIEATVMDARFCKPLDEGLIRQLAQNHPVGLPRTPELKTQIRSPRAPHNQKVICTLSRPVGFPRTFQ